MPKMDKGYENYHTPAGTDQSGKKYTIPHCVTYYGDNVDAVDSALDLDSKKAKYNDSYEYLPPEGKKLGRGK